MEPTEFLRSHPPFDRLRPEDFRIAEESLEVAYFPRGAAVLERGGPRSEHLYLVRKGAVRFERDGVLVQELEEGDLFGFPSLIARAAPHVDVLAGEDLLVYRIPEEVFLRLMKREEFASFFLQDLAQRLRTAAAVETLPAGRDLAAPAQALVSRTPIFVRPYDTVEQAARTMRDLRVSSVLVETDPPGILTDRDLRSRVLAEGRGPETPVSAVMTRPMKTLPANSTQLEVLVFMLEHRVHHVPLLDGATIVGMVTDTDFLRRQANSPTSLLSGIEKLAQAGSLANYASELSGVIENLAWGGLEAAEIGRIVSRLNDALIARLLRIAEARIGRPPCPYAFIVFGSEGRMEQALLTDQDNALVYRDDTPAAAEYFGQLAASAVDGLIAASFPPCKGGFMATNWHRPLAEWERLFRGWMETPEPRALIEAANFFDYRAVGGALSLDPLAEILLSAGRERIFLAHLARASLMFEPPLGLFRQVKEAEDGVDLKRGGIVPIVSLARLHALEAGVQARPTLERLPAAAAAGVLSREGAETLVEAFRFLLRVRLRAQVKAVRAGRPPGNSVQLEDLTALERTHLRETFLAIREHQQATALNYAVSRMS
jgi:CBS domain-containing protein